MNAFDLALLITEARLLIAIPIALLLIFGYAIIAFVKAYRKQK